MIAACAFALLSNHKDELMKFSSQSGENREYANSP